MDGKYEKCPKGNLSIRKNILCEIGEAVCIKDG